MLIGCLGWGSLIWDPRELPVHNKWFEDGPFLPIEFARQSQDGRLTLVILPDGHRARSLWTKFSVERVDEAREALRKREGTSLENIGVWRSEDSNESNPVEIGCWARTKGLDAVVWTALPPKFNGKNNVIPSIEEAIEYLKNLSYEKRRFAEEYIQKAPRQIDTPFRRRFEQEFSWTPL